MGNWGLVSALPADAMALLQGVWGVLNALAKSGADLCAGLWQSTALSL